MLAPDVVDDDDLVADVRLCERDEQIDVDDELVCAVITGVYDDIPKCTFSAEVLESATSGVFLENEVILDTAAGLSLYRDVSLLKSLRDAETCIFHGMDSEGEPLRSAVKGTGEFGEAYVHTHAVGNIQSFAVLVDAADEVHYNDDEDKFYVTTNGVTRVFVRRENNMYTWRPTDVVLSVATVADNMLRYTKAEVEAAWRARELQRKKRYQSAAGKIRNCSVTGVDVARSVAIWGKDLGSLRGKTTVRKEKPVHPDELARSGSMPPRPVRRDNVLQIDLMFVNDRPYLLGLMDPIPYALIRKLSSKSSNEIWRGLRRYLTKLLSRGFAIPLVRCDGEGGVDTEFIAEQLDEMSRRMNLDHAIRVTSEDTASVEKAERFIRFEKERLRAVIKTLPYRLCKLLEEWLVVSTGYYLNIESRGEHFECAAELVDGIVADEARDYRFGFGDYCEIAADKTDNSMKPRTRAAIALMPADRYSRRWYFWIIGTKQVVRRSNATALPLTEEMINLLNSIAGSEKRPAGSRLSEAVRIETWRMKRNGGSEDVIEDLGDEARDDNVEENLPQEFLPHDVNEPDDGDLVDVEQFSDFGEADNDIIDDVIDDEDPAVAEQVQQHDAFADAQDPIWGDAPWSDDEQEEIRQPVENDNPPTDVIEDAAPAEAPPVEEGRSLRPRRTAPGFWAGAAVTTANAAGVQKMKQKRVLSTRHRIGARRELASVRNQFLKRSFALNMTVKQALDKLGRTALLSIVKELLQLIDRGTFEPMNLDAMTKEQLKLVITSSMFLKEKYTDGRRQLVR